MENKRKKAFVAILTVASRLLGLARSLLCAFFFGTSANADLLNYTFGIPNQARKCLEEGTGNLSIISCCKRVGKEIVLGNIFSIHLFFLLFIIIFGLPLSYLVLSFSSFDSFLFSKGILMFFLFLIFLFFYSLSTSISGFLQAEGRAVCANVLPLIQSVLSVLFLYAFIKKLDVISFPLAMALSSIAFFLGTLLFLMTEKKRITPVFRLEGKFVKPYLSNLSVLALSVLISFPYFLSSSMHQKSTTFFSNAYMLIILPYGFLLALINSFSFPRLARLEGEKRKKELYSSFSFSIFFMLISSAAFFAFANEICQFLFAYGKYDTDDALMTARFLKIMIPGAFFLLLFSYFERLMFLEGKDGKVKCALILQLVFSYLMILFFKKSIYSGALIYSFSNLLCFLSVLLTYRNKDKVMSKAFFKAVLMALPEIIFSIIYRANGINMFDHFPSRFQVAPICILIYLLVFLLSMLIWKIINIKEKGPAVARPEN